MTAKRSGRYTEEQISSKEKWHKIVVDFIELHPIKIIKNEDNNVEVLEGYFDLLHDSYSTLEELNSILKNPQDFFTDIESYYECGATIKIVECTLSKNKINNLSKQKVYELCWPDNSISDRYGDDFVFDIKEFGYECFSFNGKTYLCSGIPG